MNKIILDGRTMEGQECNRNSLKILKKISSGQLPQILSNKAEQNRQESCILPVLHTLSEPDIRYIKEHLHRDTLEGVIDNPHFLIMTAKILTICLELLTC
jgi:hypothetical protein